MPIQSIQHPFYPIIYVRGYAGTMAEVEDTVATPYMGFNLGSTKLRQTWEQKLEKYIFESPLVRLMKDHGYKDVYEEGEVAVGPVAPRSVFILRYYDDVSKSFGQGKQLEVEFYAERLDELVAEVRRKVCGGNNTSLKNFRVYLVAHSMGGLICRCFLQNPRIGKAAHKKLVDKVFTFATPHNGIDLRLLGNVPGFLSKNKFDNFNREHMAIYLGLAKNRKAAVRLKRVDSLNGRFPAEKFFCLVGTGARDYPAAGGAVKHVVGPLSDGLVRIDNASVQGGPRAFVHRSHSGPYGIVNSEEGYNNLVRFLFGSMRIDGRLKVHDITLPPKLQRAKAKGKKIRASYHFETVVRVRGKRWDLHRRTVSENSAIFRSYKDLIERRTPRHPYLFSLFLSGGEWAKINRRRTTLGFSFELRVLVPEYVVDGFLFLDDHYEGGYIFRDTLVVEIVPGKGREGIPAVRYRFASNSSADTFQDAVLQVKKPKIKLDIPLDNPHRPGLKATLELTALPWNRP